MRRTLKFSLNLANINKRQVLTELYKEYCKGVNQYLSILSSQNKYILSNQEVKKNNVTLPEGIKQCAYNKAIKVWKSWRRNKKKGNLPAYNGCLDLDSRFIKVEKSKNSTFDYWVRVSTLDKGKRAIVPFRSYDYANQYWQDWELCNGGKIQFQENDISLILTFETETPTIKRKGREVGIDIGIKKLMVDSDGNRYGEEIEAKMDKIQKKEQGSRAFKRALRERDEYINKTAKELPFTEVKTIVMENIKDIKKNTKKERRLRKEFRNKFQRWTYAKLLSRISQLAEISGVHYLLVDPAYTSQICSICGFAHKLNRHDEIFLCRNCGYIADADHNASKNILMAYLAQENMTPGSMKGDTLFQ